MNPTLKSIAVYQLPAIGQKLGRWTILKTDCTFPDGHNRRAILCRCDCGTEKLVDFGNLMKGKTKSCGCREYKGILTPRHRLSGTKLYKCWNAMVDRCINPNNRMFHYYGGRGISVCDEWAASYKVFHDWAMSNGYRKELEIDRIDTNGHYCPTNCRWTTRAENMRNTRRTIKITAFGVTKCLTDWVKNKRCKVCGQTVLRRLKKGWTAENAISIPINKKNHFT